MTETPNLHLKKADLTEPADIRIYNEDMDLLDAACATLQDELETANAELGKKANKEWVESIMALKLSQDGGTLSEKTTVLEAVLSVSVGTTFFVNDTNALLNAVDAPARAEIQYLVLMDRDKVRRTVMAVQYIETNQQVWIRDAYASRWLSPKWTPLATATPPQEFDLPLKAGYRKGTYGKNNFFKNQFGEVTINISISKADNGPFDIGDFEIAALPTGYYENTIIGSGVIGSAEGKVASCILSVEANGALRMHNYTPFTGETTLQACISYLCMTRRAI